MDCVDLRTKLTNQASIIASLLKKRPNNKGENWYLIDQQWMKKFKKYVGLDELDNNQKGKHPGKLNNAGLFEKGKSNIRSGLIQDIDFILVPESAWNLLTLWYGLVSGQQPINRKTVACGSSERLYVVEVYFRQLKFCYNFELVEPIVMEFSVEDGLQKVINKLRVISHIPNSHKVRLWGQSSSGKFFLLPVHRSVQNVLSLVQSQYIVIQTKKSYYHHWKPELMSRERCETQRNIPRATDLHKYGVKPFKEQNKPGLCGLFNMGNTCYMNSVVQCLSNCPPLASYFVQNKHMSHINSDSKQGSGGEVAKSFARLIQILWSGKCNKFYPFHFMKTVRQYLKQFTSGNQHDSQEFMAYILNILHEDLNIAYSKSSSALFEKHSYTDAVEEAWHTFKLRNDSVIVDNFYGLLKSAIRCDICDKVNTTFDPFMFVSLPIVTARFTRKVRYVPFSQTAAVADYLVSVPYEGSVFDLFLEIGKFIVASPESMILGKFVDNNFHSFFSWSDKLSLLEDDCDLILFGTPVKISGPQVSESHLIMAVVLCEVNEQSTSVNIGRYFGIPFIIHVCSQTTTYEELYHLITVRMSRYIKWYSTDPSDKSSEEMQVATSSIPFRLFLVDWENQNQAQEISNTKGVSVLCKEHLNHKTIVIQWTAEMRNQWFNDSVLSNIGITTCTAAAKFNLQDSLDAFMTEKLGNGDTWKCSSCNKYTSATIKSEICKLPTVLVIHLKRYMYENGQLRKVDELVDFPVINFNLDKYTITSGEEHNTYDLVAVCNHYGSVNEGHYTAFAKNAYDEWYCFNDSEISGLSEKKIKEDFIKMIHKYNLPILVGNICKISSQMLGYSSRR